MNAIHVLNYTKKIKDNTVLSNVSITIKENKVVGFIGRNGSGKTMMFRAISGLIKPTSGKVIIFNKELGIDSNYPEDIGILIDIIGFWPDLTGYDNLVRLAEIKKKITNEEIRNTLVRVGLDPTDKRPVKKYSMGMRQRLSIAQAIMEKPKLIILDEPTNSLDTEGVEILRNIVIEEKQRGATILLASHIENDIRILCDEIYSFESGRVIKYEET